MPVAALRDTPVAIVAMGGSDHHYLGVERHLRDVLSFFGAHSLPTAVYLASRDFDDGVPGPRAAQELDGLLDAIVVLTRALRGRRPWAPPRWPHGSDCRCRLVYTSASGTAMTE